MMDEEEATRKKFIELCKGMSDPREEKLILDLERVRRMKNLGNKLREAIAE